ncbi:hypothetical protein [Streptomyces yanii]|uniref:hypothetical protein n=1 Tax=Streptomyces yanii TaxID=78510 RepID=UPI0031E57707
MTVQVDPDFPAVRQYTWTADGSILNGRTNGSDELVVNGRRYTPAVTSTVGDDAVDYTLRIAELDLTLQARLAVSGHVLTSVSRTSRRAAPTSSVHWLSPIRVSFRRVPTSPVPNSPTLSCPSPRLQPTRPTIDKHTKITDAPVDSAPHGTTYAILSTDRLAASVETNSLDDQSRLLIRTAGTGEAKSTSCSSGT